MLSSCIVLIFCVKTQYQLKGHTALHYCVTMCAAMMAITARFACACHCCCLSAKLYQSLTMGAHP